MDDHHGRRAPSRPRALGRRVARTAAALLLSGISTLAGSETPAPTVEALAERIQTQQAVIEALREEVTRLQQQVEAIRDEPARGDDRGLARVGQPAGEAARGSDAADTRDKPAPHTPDSDRDRAARERSALRFSGDFRLRYEANTGPKPRSDRHRGVLRARLAARYALTDRLTLGARVTTGDRDNPNSADVTLSDFNDSFEVSLDQAFAHYGLGPADAYAGQFTQILRGNDLVWDGDVNPQGAGVSVALNGPGRPGWAGRGLLMIIDEDAVGSDSTMGGVQGEATLPFGAWTATAAAGYYDYSLNSLSGADAGDFRSNRLDASGDYLSDFDLINLIAEVRHPGLGPGWPLRLVADYVRNTGAVDDEDTGWAADIYLGETEPGRWRLRYGYAEA